MGPAILDRLRILIVDDEPGALNALGDIFEDLGFEVSKAASGKAAREAIGAQEFDVALLDIRLPDTRGTDLLREIRQASDNTRCIMVTASAEAEDAINALNDGASAYITKPIDVDVMVAKIREVVTQYRKTVEDRRRLRELDVVKNVGDVAMDLDLNRMLNNVLRCTVDGFAADGGVVLLLEPDGHTLRGVAEYGLTDEPVQNYVMPVGSGFAGRVASLRRVLSVEDLSGMNYGVPSYILRTNVTSLIGAPVGTAKGIIGVLIVAWRNTRPFTIDDEHLIGVLGQRLGLATENARLYANEDASKQRAEYLAYVSQELNTRIEDEHRVIDRITRLATQRLGDGCAIFLKRPNSDFLDGVLSYHRDPRKQEFIESHLRKSPVRLGEGNVGRVALTGEPILTGSDAANAYPERAYLNEVGIVSALAVPLRSHGEIFGVMSFSITESDRQYSSEDLRLAREFADRAAVAIENARLLKESTEKREELQALFQLTRLVTSSLKESEVLESLLQGTVDLIDTPAGCIVTLDADRGTLHVNEEIGISNAAAVEVVSSCLSAWHSRMLETDEPFEIDDLMLARNLAVAACAQRHHLHSMLSVPFDVNGRREGVLIAFTHDPDPDLAQKRQILSTLGGLAGVAITNARSFYREQKIAERLQQWILSTEPNVDVGTLQIAKDYHAALNEANVGGDFFDIFTLSPETFGIVIGDVSGKGLEAALHTQAVKHTLRAYALRAASQDPALTEPDEVLARTNDAVCFMIPTDIFITLFFAVVNAKDRTIRYANAGHDSPILLHPDGSTEMLESTGRALGLLAGAQYDSGEIVINPADVLLLYTDGVTEARHNSRFLEIDGVIDLLRRHARGSAEDIVTGIYTDVREFTEGNLHDDIALLALRVPDEG